MNEHAHEREFVCVYLCVCVIRWCLRVLPQHTGSMVPPRSRCAVNEHAHERVFVCVYLCACACVCNTLVHTCVATAHGQHGALRTAGVQ